MIVIFAGFKLN